MGTDRRNAFGQPIGEALPDWTPRPLPPRASLEGRFCIVEPLDAERHAGALYSAYAQATDARDWTYLSNERELNLDAFKHLIAIRSASADPLHMAVVRDMEVAGSVALMRIDPSNGVIEIGHVHFAPSMQRTPAATEAIFLLMRRVFDDLGYRRLEWKCDSLNAPSRRAATRLGFTFEGTFRNAVVTKNRSRDTAWYGMVSEDWPEIRAAFERWLAPDNFTPAGRQIVRLAVFRAGAA